ncbi:C1 family peptidase [Nocardia anaemiae]|uniref:C1 family peptidase n=1 Tax=Nocardia anaemiae TaxID=263910 RepID=UPI0007A53C3A|nr:C1 family peptidase [Nocardia anaemiae]
MTLTWLADLRAGTEPVGDQGPRRTCMSWAATAAHEHHGRGPLSIEYLHWACGPGGQGTLFGVRRALRDRGQPPRQQWPYDPARSPTTAYDPPTGVTGPFHTAAARKVPHTPKRLVDQLDSGLLPVAAIRVTQQFLHPVGGIVDGTESGSDGHAVAVVGVAQLDHDLDALPAGHHLVCVRNSWGTAWGQDGHALVTERAWNACAMWAAVVEPPDGTK